MRLSNIKPHGNLVLIEVFRPTETFGGLALPIDTERYPTSGWVIALGPKCKEEIPLGAQVVIQNHGFTTPPAALDTFIVLFNQNQGQCRIDADLEPQIRELWSKHKRTGEDFDIVANDIDHEEEIRFKTSDISDLQFGIQTQAGWNIQYTAAVNIPFLIDDRELILVPEKEILAIISLPPRSP